MRRTVAAAAATVMAVAGALAGCSSAAPVHGTTTAARSSQSGTPQASSNKAAFAMFTGLWSGHGNQLWISADGSFTMQRRVYAWCSSSPPPCDSDDPIRHIITDGAIAHGVLKSVSGTVATGTIMSSTDTALFPTGSLSFDLDVSNDLISAFNLDWCGPSAPVDKCGL